VCGAIRIGIAQAKASAKPEESVLADVAAQGHHPDAPEEKVQNTAMGPSNVGFTALWTCNNHGQQSP
jgi:hypothetical protein